MHHPGPPRFTAVGSAVELAPRDPDPDATYRWRVVSRPSESRVDVGDEAVEEFVPDVPGRYRVELDAPDGTHTLTVRVFPADKAIAGIGGASGSGISGMSGSSPSVSDFASGSGSARGSGGGDGGRPRVRLDGGREGDTVALHAQATPHPDSEASPADLDVEFYVDDRDGFNRTALTPRGHDATLPVPDAPVRIHAVAVGEQYSVADAVRVHPDGSVERLYQPPAWAEDATIYEIYVRGFTDDHSFAGIKAKLDYLAEFGVDTLWLTPVLQNDDAPHGYNITDFFGVADDLGTREEYEALVAAAHDRGMKVLFDLVLNHSARQHPYFEDAYGNPDSPYYDWYEWQDSGEPGTYFDWEKIANFDYKSLEVRRHLLDAVDEWAPLVDGFRCDMAWAVPAAFWKEIRDRVKDHDSEFLLLDETVPYVADFHEGMFDVHFDTTTYFTLREIGRGHADADALYDAVEQRARVGFPDAAGFMLYIENHDELRYVDECGRPEVEAAAGALFTLPGVPMVYSGQEFGERLRRGHVDWDAADEELRAHYKALLETNDETPALARDADFAPVDYEAASPGVTAYARDTGSERVVVVLNFGPETETVGLPGERVDATDLVSGESVAAEGGVDVESVVVLQAER
ncbi:alpha-amylase MalA [Halorarius litoreus]|uniref:alpha-amylase MalA n=1 Tax=Halorarius litoreus TaxID=2962676 RepID=UPI0020CFA2DD|nr:alpha-amylase MalA [Halorarius litoreus]